MPWGACSGSRLPVRARLAAELHVDEHVAELVQHVLDLRELDELTRDRWRRGSAAPASTANAPAGPVAASMYMVGRGLDHRAVVVADELGEAAEAVELRAEPGVVRPVTGEAGGRDAQHEQPRVAVEQLALVDADLVERRRLEVLDEHVGLLDEAHEQLARLRDAGGRGCTTACSGRSSCSSRGGCRAGRRRRRPPGAYIDSRLPSSIVRVRAGRGSPWWWAGTPTGSRPGSPRRRGRRGAG